MKSKSMNNATIFFIKQSKLRYNETKDEHNGCNVLITADESFNTVRVIKVSATTFLV